MSYLYRLRMALWLVGKPRYWKHLLVVISRLFSQNRRARFELRQKGLTWARAASVEYDSAALRHIGIEGVPMGLPACILEEGLSRANMFEGTMGGPGHKDFIYDVVRLLKPTRVVETGVAYGWSSLAILSGFGDNKTSRLFSVDMPYPLRNNEDYVGIVVPERLRRNWVIIDKPDVTGLPEALEHFHNDIDLCHYDSDKSPEGRAYAYPLLWNSLASGGLFISDDVGDNLAFAEFAESLSEPYIVLHVKGDQYLGAIRKS